MCRHVVHHKGVESWGRGGGGSQGGDRHSMVVGPCWMCQNMHPEDTISGHKGVQVCGNAGAMLRRCRGSLRGRRQGASSRAAPVKCHIGSVLDRASFAHVYVVSLVVVARQAM